MHNNGQKKQAPLSTTGTLWHYGIPPFIIAGLTYLFYKSSLSYAFQFDDVASINKFFFNRQNSFANLFFQHPRWISYWINSVHHALYTFEPFGYRLFNVCLHATSAILVFFILFKALSSLKNASFFRENSFPIAIITSLLFALHPVQTQTVTYVIQGQLEGTACFFALLCTLIYLYGATTQHQTVRLFSYTLLCTMGLLGTGSKEIFIVTPFLLVIVDWFFIAQGELNELKKRWAILALFASCVIGCYLWYYGLRHFGILLTMQHEAINNIGNILTENRYEKIRPWPFFISQFKVIVHYITMFVWPFNICVEYDWKLSRSFFSPDAFFPFLLVAGLWATMVYGFLKNRIHPLLFGALWFFIVLAPRSSFIPSSELLTDYKTFMGSMGILFIFGCAITYGITRIRQMVERISMVRTPEWVILPALIMAAIPVGFMTMQRNIIWSCGTEFWGNILHNAPGKARAYNNYGVALSEQGKYKESIPYYLKAIQMDNTYPDPVNNIAVAYAQSGNLDRGIFYLERVLEMQPNYPEGHNNLASFLIQKNEFAKAEASLHRAIKLRPHYGKAYYNLGKVFYAQNRMQEAYDNFKNACTIADLDTAAGFETFGKICIALNKYSEAIEAFKNMYRYQPNFETIFHIANAYHLNNQFKEALSWYSKAETFAPKDFRVPYNIGETLARLGDYEKALVYFQKAKGMNYPHPNLSVRVAYCLRNLQRTDEARTILESIVHHPQAPKDLIALAQHELSAIPGVKA